MGPLLEAAKNYTLDNDSISLGEKTPEELQDDLERLDELDRELDPNNKRSFSGRSVALSGVFSASVTGVVGWSLYAAGAVFSLANPAAIAVVGGAALGGLYIGHRLTSSDDQNAMFKEHSVRVVKPKAYVMRLLSHYGALKEDRLEEFERLKGEVKDLKERETRVVGDLDQAKQNIDGLTEDRTSLEQTARNLETTRKSQLERIHAQVETEKELERKEKELRNQLGTKESELVTARQEAEDLLAKTRKELEKKRETDIGALKARHTKAQEHLQRALDSEKHFKRSAYSKFLHDKQNDIENLKVQRNFLVTKLAANAGLVKGSLNPRIADMEQKLRDFRKRAEQDETPPQTGSPRSPSPDMSILTPVIKEEIDGGLKALKNEVAQLTTQLQEKEQDMLKALEASTEKENQLTKERDNLQLLNDQLQNDIDTNQQLINQLQEQVGTNDEARQEALRLLEVEKQKLLDAQQGFDEHKLKLEESIDLLKNERDQLVEKAKRDDTELTSVKQQLDDLTQKIAVAEQEHQTELQMLKDQHTEALTLDADKVRTAVNQELVSKEEEFRRKLSEANDKVEELTQKAKVSEEAYEALNKQYTDSAGDVDKVRDIVTTMLPPSVEEGPQDFKAVLEQGLKVLKAEKEALESAVKTVESNRNQLKVDFEQLKQEKEDILKGATDSDRTLSELRDKVKELGQQMSDQASRLEKEADEAKQKYEQELAEKQLAFENLRSQQEQFKVKDAALTSAYRLALKATKEAKDTIQSRDEELAQAKKEFSEAQKQWDLTKADFDQQILEASVKERGLSSQLETLRLTEEWLKTDAQAKGTEITKLQDRLKNKDLVLDQDKVRLDTLEQEKVTIEKAARQAEEERGQLQSLYDKLEESKNSLQDELTLLERERDKLLQDVATEKDGRTGVEKQLTELQEELNDAKTSFETEKTKVEQAHQRQIEEKEEEFVKAKERFEKGSARQKARAAILHYAHIKVREAKDDAEKQIDAQKVELAAKQAELERRQEALDKNQEELKKLQHAHDELNKKYERNRQTFLRKYSEPTTPERGYVRAVGENGARLKLDLFDFDQITNINDGFERVKVETSDLVGDAAKRQLADKLKEAQIKLSRAHEEAHREYDPGTDGIPTLTQQREKMKQALEEYRDEVIKCKEFFEDKKGDEVPRKAIFKNLQEAVDAANAGIKKVNGEEQSFKLRAKKVDELMEDYSKTLKTSTVKKMAEATNAAFQSISHSPFEDVRDLAYARLVDALAENFSQSTPKALPGPNEIEALERMREELEEKKKVLQQFHPDNLPLDTGRSLSQRGTKYLAHVVKSCTAELDGQCRTPGELDEVFPVEARNEGGMALARKMLADPKICADVYSWFSSLQDSHAKIKKSKDTFDYERASIVGLEVLRHDHGLVYMPTPFELLTVIKADLGEVDSKFTTEACRQHRGTSKDSHQKWRREKLLERCDTYLEKENEAGVDRLRGQPTLVTEMAQEIGSTFSLNAAPDPLDESEGELMAHAHKDVLDCFAGARGSSVVSVQELSRREETAFHVYPLALDRGGLMNTFFEGCNGRPQLRVDKKSKDEFLSVEGHNPEPGPLVFKKTKQGWKVSLGGTNYWVDPSVITQNPKLAVPFEWKAHNGQFQRDWIPLRDAHGNTAILLLRKSAGMGDRYFMYQPKENGELIPKPIGATNIAEERVEAQLLYMAALSGQRAPATESAGNSLESVDYGLHSLPSNTGQMMSLAAVQQQMKSGDVNKKVLQVLNMKREWAKHADQQDLTNRHAEIVARSHQIYQLAPLESQPLSDYLAGMEVPPNELREIVHNKRSQQNAIQTYTPAKFSTFSVGAGFDTASKKYFEELRSRSVNGESPVVDAQQKQCQDYREGVFRELQVFKGCELDDGAYGENEGTPVVVERNFAKVVKQNTDHCIRMQQQVDKLRTRLVGNIRDSIDQNQRLEEYTDQQLLDKAVMEFEKGNIVLGIYDRNKEKNIQLLVRWMQAENDLRLHSRMKRKLSGLNDQLLQIKKDAGVQMEEDLMAYQGRCQEWNLEMALAASEMQALQDRLDSYKGKTLDAATRAIMSFERRAETVLRSGVGSDQVREVENAIADISLAMKDDQPMARVSQLGTGWGKSTMVQLWTDLACSLNVGHADRSVLVIAPTRNKLDLDHMLARYYDQKGLEYQSLDLMKEYVNPASKRANKAWWRDPALVEIHNRLLGLPKGTPEDKRDALVETMRAPVGASIQDVQILVHLRRKLQSQDNLAPVDQVALRRLDAIADLFRESMIFADEWDSALVPPLPHELDEVKGNVNKALTPLGNQPELAIKRNDIIHGHGTFIFGCKRKHLLSATTGTTYTAAVASGATKIDEVARKCNTDPYTTSSRVWHLLGMAEPVMVDSEEGDGGLNQQVYDKVVERVGVDRPVMLFNSNATGGDNFEQAANNFACLSKARQKVGGSSSRQKGMLYYDGNKKLCQYLPGDARYDSNSGKNKNVPLTREDEELIRASGGNMVDVCLGQSESVGTDAPQCLDSAGVFVGLFEQRQNGRFDLSAQQMGRLTRATRSMRKPQQFFMVVDSAAIRKLDDCPEKKEYLDSYDSLKDKKRTFAQMFKKGMPGNVAKAVEAPINVLPATLDQVESAQDNIKRNLEFELKCQEEAQWVRLGLTEEQTAALREVKKAQWEAKVKYLELAAKELAVRDVNDHTASCEVTLEQAAVDSAMESAYSTEDNWLKKLSGDGERLNSDMYRFEADASKTIPDDPNTDMPDATLRLTEKLVRDAMVAEAGKKLSSLPRRVVTPGIDKGVLATSYDPAVARARVKSVFAEIRTNGLDFKMDSPVNDVHAELKSYAVTALEDAETRIKKILDATKRDNIRIGGLGHEHNAGLLKPLQDKLAKQLAQVRDNNSFEHAMNTEKFLKEIYGQLLLSLNYLALGSQDVGTTTEMINDQIKDLVGPNCDYKLEKPVTANRVLRDMIPVCIDAFKGYVAPKLWGSTEAKAPAIYTLKWAAKRGKRLPPKVSVPAVETVIKTIPIKESRKKAESNEPRMVDVISFPKFNQAFEWERFDESGSTLPKGSFDELTRICEKGRSAIHVLKCWEAAKQFCSPNDTDSSGFEECVTEMEQKVLGDYEEVHTEIKQELYDASMNIKAQHQLMAAAGTA